MGFFRARDGRYVAFHRVKGYGRRVFRSESWDLRHWTSEPRMVLEPGPQDGCQVQFYGYGACPYGHYELGTLWLFHTDEDELQVGHMKGYQDTELTYARAGHAVHRPTPSVPFIPIGGPQDWDRGNLQCASQPVFLPDQIRYYYAGTTMRHATHWEREPQTAGLGLATLQPDRFVALHAAQEAALLTTVLRPAQGALHLNYRTAPGGWIKAAVLDVAGQPLPGYGLDDCLPATGDELLAPLRWRGASGPLPDRLRLHLVASQAELFAIASVLPGEQPVYHQFDPL
jgi:hypothetical protein